MCTFENILRFSHFSIAFDMSRITHFLAEIMIPQNSASGNFLTFSRSGENDLSPQKDHTRCPLNVLSIFPVHQEKTLIYLCYNVDIFMLQKY